MVSPYIFMKSTVMQYYREEKIMNVGFMRNFKKPNEMAYLTAKMSKYYGINIVYLNPKDIDIDNNIARGRVLEGEKWVRKEMEIPKLIDISPYCFKEKNKEVISYLRKNVYLTDNRKNVINKEKLQEELKNDTMFSHLVIPTTKLESFNDIVDMQQKYSTIVIKPIKGERGKGIYILKKQGIKYTIGHYTEEKKISKRRLYKLYKEELSEGYIIQKYINSRSKNGDPFDCRLHFEKNGQGKWEIAKMYIRIGIGQTIISNMNQGGGMADPKSFLKANFPDKWEQIYKSLEDLGKIFPYKFEELRKTDIMTLGIDVGIDQNGDLYIFEANGAPDTSRIKAEVINLRTQYYKYLLNNKIK